MSPHEDAVALHGRTVAGIVFAGDLFGAGKMLSYDDLASLECASSLARFERALCRGLLLHALCVVSHSRFAMDGGGGGVCGGVESVHVLYAMPLLLESCLAFLMVRFTWLLLVLTSGACRPAVSSSCLAGGWGED